MVGTLNREEMTGSERGRCVATPVRCVVGPDSDNSPNVPGGVGRVESSST
jgi:hypothetical protein